MNLNLIKIAGELLHEKEFSEFFATHAKYSKGKLETRNPAEAEKELLELLEKTVEEEENQKSGEFRILWGIVGVGEELDMEFLINSTKDSTKESPRHPLAWEKLGKWPPKEGEKIYWGLGGYSITKPFSSRDKAKTDINFPAFIIEEDGGRISPYAVRDYDAEIHTRSEYPNPVYKRENLTGETWDWAIENFKIARKKII